MLQQLTFQDVYIGQFVKLVIPQVEGEFNFVVKDLGVNSQFYQYVVIENFGNNKLINTVFWDYDQEYFYLNGNRTVILLQDTNYYKKFHKAMLTYSALSLTMIDDDDIWF